MIFSPDLCEAILSGRKTVTRRPVKFTWDDSSGEIPCRYEQGKSYALQPGRGKKAIGRIWIESVEMEPLDGVEREPEAEGFVSADDFYSRWQDLYGSPVDPDQAVWRIAFRLGEGTEG